MDARRLERLYRESGGERRRISRQTFAAAIEASVAYAFKGRERTAAAVDRYLDTLYLEDLALACACAQGHEAAWDEFMREYRPVLYRAADALDATGGAREVADALYAELYERGLLKSFHGRSSLSTWLRAVLSQRYVDRVRVVRRFAPLPEDAIETHATRVSARIADPDRARLFPMLLRAFDAAVNSLPSRDRLRLHCYYAQELTLAQTGRLLGEHEATVSRQLARSRAALRRATEHYLREREQLSDAEVAGCFEAALADPGELDVRQLLERKNSSADRSSS